MKFFKLELINRENNYNKMFNANPNVGIMNPFDGQSQKNNNVNILKRNLKI